MNNRITPSWASLRNLLLGLALVLESRGYSSPGAKTRLKKFRFSTADYISTFIAAAVTVAVEIDLPFAGPLHGTGGEQPRVRCRQRAADGPREGFGLGPVMPALDRDDDVQSLAAAGLEE